MIFRTYNNELNGITNKTGILNHSFSEIGNEYKLSGVLGIPSLFNGKLLDSDIDKIQQYNKFISDGVSYQTAWNRTMLDASLTAQRLAESNNGAAVSTEQLVAVQKSGTKIISGFAKALSVAGNIALSLAISAAISAVAKAWDEYSNAQTKALEKAEEAQSKMDSLREKITSQRELANNQSLLNEYRALAKGVDSQGNNINLSNSEFERYNEISNQIADNFPNLVTGFSAAGGAILSCKDKYVKVWCGLENLRNSDISWYSMGVYVINDTGYSYNASTKQLSLTLLDKMALLDGTLGGKVLGAKDVSITRFTDGEYHSSVTIAEDKSYTALKAGTVLKFSVPSDVSSLFVDFDIAMSDVEAVRASGSNGFRVEYDRYIPEYNTYEHITKIYSYEEGVKGFIDIDTENVDSIKITLLLTIYASKIGLISHFQNTAISEYSFSGDNNIITSDFSNEVKDFSGLTIDTTTGRETMLSEVIIGGLTQASIKDYQIIDIYETVPYDQDFSIGVSWYEIFSTLTNLYMDIEMFFDVNGTFVVRHYSTTNDDEIVLDKDILNDLVVDISNNNSFEPVYNTTEIWGQSLESDYYAENTEEEPYLVKCENNNFSVNFIDLVLTDQNKIPNGAVLAFKTPNKVELSNSPTLSVNTVKTAVSDIVKIDKIFTCDDFAPSKNPSSVTGYMIDDKEQYYIKAGCVGIYTEDMLVDDNTTNHKNIPANGENNWYNYGARSANKTYLDSNDSIVAIPNIIGSNSNPVSVDGIQFKGTYYNMLNASAMVYISATNRHSIDLTIRKYCIEINAREGEIYRFYYTNMTDKLYAANSSGVFQKDSRPFVDYDTAVNGLNYSDFVVPTTDKYYVFYYSTHSNDLGFRLYGMSKIVAKQGEYPILNYSDDTPVDYDLFQPNASYCFRYNNGKVYYLGQWQIHSAAIEVLSIPEKGSDEWLKYAQKLNCNNIVFTQYDERLAVENIGIKANVLSGGEYEDIFSDDLALQRAEYENWKGVRIVDNVSLSLIQIPWLDVNEKVTFQLPYLPEKVYMVNRITYSNTSDVMNMELATFYPLYIS